MEGLMFQHLLNESENALTTFKSILQNHCNSFNQAKHKATMVKGRCFFSNFFMVTLKNVDEPKTGYKRFV